MSFFSVNKSRPADRLFVAASGLLVLAAGAWVVFALRGWDNVLHWDVLSELSEAPYVFDSFVAAGQRFQLPAVALTLLEQYVASPMNVHHPLADALCLGLGVLGAVLIWATLPTLPRLWYLAAMTLFIVGLSTLQLDALAGRTDRLVTIGVVGLLVGVSFYFHASRGRHSLLQRMLAGLLLSGLLFVFLWKAANATTAALLAQAYPVGMGLACIGIFSVSYEIMIGLVWLATNQRGRNRLLQLTLLTLFYLLNLLLPLLHNTRYLNWNLLYLSPFVFLALAAAMSFWGQHQRDAQGVALLPFRPAGRLLHTGLLMVLFAVLAYLSFTQNDPALEALEDVVSYTFLLTGLLFFGYVILNFGPLFRQGLPVYRVLFKPRYVTRFHVRGLSLILLIIILNANRYFPFYQAVAGYFNAQADVATAHADYRLAETLYKQGLAFEFQNHKSNYGLASLAWIQGDFRSAAQFFGQALLKKPSPYAYAGLSRSLLNEDRYFDALFSARESVGHFPGSGELLNNLALLHARGQGYDSAFYFLQKAEKQVAAGSLPKANQLALLLKNGQLQRALPLAETDDNPYRPYRINQLAVFNFSGKESNAAVALPADSVLTLFDMAQLQNQTFNGLRQGHVPVPTPTLLRLLQKPENEDYADELGYLLAVQAAYSGEVLLALDVLSARASADTSAGGDRWRQPLAALLNRELQAHVPVADDWETQLRRHPLQVSLLARATQAYNRRQQPGQAYDLLLKALNYRPFDPQLLTYYILQALEMGQQPYAEARLRDLQQVSPAAYAEFLPTYQQKLASIEKRRSAFK